MFMFQLIAIADVVMIGAIWFMWTNDLATQPLELKTRTVNVEPRNDWEYEMLDEMLASGMAQPTKQVTAYDLIPLKSESHVWHGKGWGKDGSGWNSWAEYDKQNEQMLSEECPHGLSLWLCADPINHYPADL